MRSAVPIKRLPMWLLAGLTCLSSGAQETLAVHDWRVCAPDGVALGGFDVTSYWQADMPSAGQDDLTVQLGELTYRFANAANRQAFLADPARYLPTYQGWCSTNLSMGSLACPDYTNFKIEDGRLLLFEQIGFSNGRDVWNSDPLLHRRQADTNFQAFLAP